MARRVLIVSPNFPPKSTADLHRVRMSLPYYRSFGWDATVLSISPESCEGIDDPLLAASLPKDAEIVRVPAWDKSLCRKLGFGLLEYRGLLPLSHAGGRLLATRTYDLAFFSTTAFMTLALGPLWRRKFGVRIVYDIQDPWYLGRESSYDRSNVPGSWWKYRLSQAIAKHAEAFAMKGADRIITVSEAHGLGLQQRYRFLDKSIFHVIPFGAAERDRDIAWRLPPGPARDGRTRRWVSVGAVGPGMVPVVGAFLEALARRRQQEPGIGSSLHIDFIGTNYAPAGRTRFSVLPLAETLGLRDLVSEVPHRLPYFEALKEYRDCDAILLFGAETGGYMPSRLFNCLMMERPILAMFHRDSAVARLAPGFPSMTLAQFSSSPREAPFLDAIAKGMAWLDTARVDKDEIAKTLKPWSAEELTRRQCEVFDLASATPAVHP